jgi:hypothetical protein
MRDRTRLAAALLWGLVALAWACKLQGRAQDDLYVTYRYAHNLAAGQGFVFNPGERVFGLTEPGLGLLLALAHRLTGVAIPWLGTLSTAVALVWVALLLLAEGRQRGRAGEALVAGSLLLACSYVWASHGAAAPLVLAVLLAAARVAGERPALAGALAGGAVWLRPDAGVGVAALAVLLWWEGRRPPLRYLVAAAGVVGLGLLAAWGWFGQALPVTLAAKRVMAEARLENAAGSGFWERARPLLARHAGPLWGWAAGLGLLGHLPRLEGAGRAGRLLAAYSLALLVAYPLLGVPFYVWYTVPTAVGSIYGLAALAGACGRLVSGRLAQPRSRPLVAGLVGAAVLAAPLASGLPASWRWASRFEGQAHLEVYRQAAFWLRDHSPPQAAVAYVEIGVLGFYSELPLRDLLGLVTPESIPYAAAGDLVGAFLVQPTEFVARHDRGRMDPLLLEPWFARAYREVARFGAPGRRGGVLTLYRRQPDARLPPPRPPRRGGDRGGASDPADPADSSDSVSIAPAQAVTA